MSEQADILLLAGGLTDTGHIAEAETLCEELRACKIPVVGVLGNHDYEADEQDAIKKALNDENAHILEGNSVVIGKVGVAGIKGFGGGFDQHMLPLWGEK